MRSQRFLWTLLLSALLPATLTAWLILPAGADTLLVPQDYPTIQAAINAARRGDTIQVSPSTYPENVIVNQTVTIIGEDPATTIVDGGGNNMVFNIQADNVELHNLTIYNGGRRYSGVTIDYPYDGLTIRNTRIIDNVVGVAISEADGNTIEDNIFINNHMYGIDVKYSSNTIIRNNQMSDGAYGIEISDTSGSRVVNNTLHDMSYAIYVPYSNNNNISANTLSGNSWNIYLTYSNSNLVGNNTVSGGSVGIQVMRSEGNSLLNNTASSSSYGIYLGYCGANTVSGNTVPLNDWGIELYNSTGSTIKENTVKDNTWGFYVVQNSKANYLYHNNIVNNVKQVYQDFTSGLNNWRTPTTPYQGNYWSDYPGEDTNGDGIGDTHRPWQGVDWYPLMNPLGGEYDVAVINVTLPVSEAIAGAPVNITVIVENQGTWSHTFNVTAKYNDTFIETKTVTDLAADANETLIFVWETSAVDPCSDYTVMAEASVHPEEVDTADNTFIDGTIHMKLPDLNDDGIVNVIDLALVGVAYATVPGDTLWNPKADVNKDNVIDIADVSIVALNYGKTCG